MLTKKKKNDVNNNNNNITYKHKKQLNLPNYFFNFK